MSSLSRATISLCLLAILALGGCGKTRHRQFSGDGHKHVLELLEPVDRAGSSGLATENTTRLGGSSPVVDAAAVARAVHPGLTEASRPQAVVLVDDRDWSAALVASELTSAPLRAALLYTEGGKLPSVSLQALRDMRPTGTSLLGGAQVIEVATASAPLGYRARTLQRGQPAVLASELEPLVAPILLVEGASVPVATSTMLAHLKQPTIYVVGPTSAVGQNTVRELERYGPVKRVNGAGPASNAIALAQYSDGSFGWGVVEPGHGLVFASASRPLDAPAAAALSASGDYGPLLLLERPNMIPAELSGYLSDIQPGYTDEPQCRPVRGVYNHGWLIGDESAISAVAQAELDSLLEISSRKACTAPPITQ